MIRNNAKILFIINPIAGGKDKKELPTLVEKYFSKDSYKITYTNHRNHASELTRQGILDGFTHFIAAGGDGTVNEVAKELINTNFNLGILPFGSGNGLARHIGIPMNIEKALELIHENQMIRIDTCELNNMPFINVSGVGFDAHIGKLFSKSKTRGFSTYLNTTINEFLNYKSEKYDITADGIHLTEDAFLISFANSSQYGNNAYIAPNASLVDGLCDVCIMKPFPALSVFNLGFRLFAKNIDESQYLQTIQAKEIVIERVNRGEIHIDGEPKESGKTLKIKVIPRSLNILISNN